MCCGSPLPPPLKRATRDTLDCELIELYGLTEGIITTLAPEDFDAHIESVGKPIPGQQLKLVRDDDVEAAPGELGEICGYGRLVMEGYHQRPDATEEATWVDTQGRRWLRTGDIGRLDDDGFLYIVDRKKDMILSGSQNIYPADIEAVMRDHPAVADVAVVGVPSERWGETPLALVVAAAGWRHAGRRVAGGMDQPARRQAATPGGRSLRRRPAAQSEWQDPQARVAQAVRRLGESQVTTPDAAAERFFSLRRRPATVLSRFRAAHAVAETARAVPARPDAQFARLHSRRRTHPAGSSRALRRPARPRPFAARPGLAELPSRDLPRRPRPAAAGRRRRALRAARHVTRRDSLDAAGRDEPATSWRASFSTTSVRRWRPKASRASRRTSAVMRRPPAGMKRSRRCVRPMRSACPVSRTRNG